MATSTHSLHSYKLVLHHEGDDRYHVVIFNPYNKQIGTTGAHLERQGALGEASRYVNRLLAQRAKAISR